MQASNFACTIYPLLVLLVSLLHITVLVLFLISCPYIYIVYCPSASRASAANILDGKQTYSEPKKGFP
jgi:hypothetical protein